MVGAVLDFPELRGDPDVKAALALLAGDFAAVVAMAAELSAGAAVAPEPLAEFVAARLASPAFDAAATAKAVLLENASLLHNQLIDRQNAADAEALRRGAAGGGGDELAALRAVTARALAKRGLDGPIAPSRALALTTASLEPLRTVIQAPPVATCGGDELPLFALCESPAERAFLEGAIRPTGKRHVRTFRRFDQRTGKDSATVSLVHPDGREVSLTLQEPFGPYRVDFLLRGTGPRMVAVEVDGFEYHERTQEQAERDRARDRALLAKGIVTVRFMAKAVFADPVKCADEAFELALGECWRAA